MLFVRTNIRYILPAFNEEFALTDKVYKMVSGLHTHDIYKQAGIHSVVFVGDVIACSKHVISRIQTVHVDKLVLCLVYVG